MRRIILATGGTGGHVFPALALAEELKKRNPELSLLFIGSDYGPEKRLVVKAGIEFKALPARGFLGRGLKAIPAAYDLARSVLGAGRVIRSFRPDVIAGFGGYASFAPALAGHFLGVPLLLHEQNAIPGVANRILGRWADRVCVSLPDTKGFRAPVTLTGNPVRRAIRDAGFLRQGKRGNKLRLLVIGGSQGAHALNRFVSESLPGLKDFAEIRLQTGSADLPMAREAFMSHNLSPELVQPFFDDMAEAYSWADAILCRAGASTCAEVAAAGLPSILVPFPAAIHDHQTLNAQSLVKAGAAILVPETRLDGLFAILKELSEDDEKLFSMSGNAIALGKNDASALIASEIEKIAEKSCP